MQRQKLVGEESTFSPALAGGGGEAEDAASIAKRVSGGLIGANLGEEDTVAGADGHGMRNGHAVGEAIAGRHVVAITCEGLLFVTNASVDGEVGG